MLELGEMLNGPLGLSKGKSRLLIVEDEPIIHEIVTMILSDAYGLAEANNGREALDILAREGQGFHPVATLVRECN